MARKKVTTKMTARVAIEALDKAHAELVKSTVAAQRAVIEIGRVWHLTCKVNKRKSPARDKVMNHGVELFGKNAATYMSNAARLYQIVTGHDKDIPFAPKEADEVLESTASVNPTSLVKVLRDWANDRDNMNKTDDGNTDDGNTNDGNTDDGNTDDGNTDDGNTDDGNTDDGTTSEPVTVERTVNAEYSTLTSDELIETFGRCINTLIPKIGDTVNPTPDQLATLKKQARSLLTRLEGLKASDNPLDKIVKKVANG